MLCVIFLSVAVCLLLRFNARDRCVECPLCDAGDDDRDRDCRRESDLEENLLADSSGDAHAGGRDN